MILFSANLSITSANYVDFAGNIGGTSYYGRGLYGRGLYSRNPAFTPLFVGNFDIIGQAYFDGVLSPVVTFVGDFAFNRDLIGDLAPQVAFSATTLSLLENFTGDLAPSVVFGADLSVDLAFTASLQGAFSFTVLFAGATLIAEPLWEASSPCPAPPWGPSDPCPPSIWTPSEPCVTVDWEDTELCNG